MVAKKAGTGVKNNTLYKKLRNLGVSAKESARVANTLFCAWCTHALHLQCVRWLGPVGKPQCESRRQTNEGGSAGAPQAESPRAPSASVPEAASMARKPRRLTAVT